MGETVDVGGVEARDVEALAERLVEFVKPYQEVVGWTSREKQLGAFVAGLLGGTERKSVEPIALAQGVDRRQLQHFVGVSPWDHRPSDAAERGGPHQPLEGAWPGAPVVEASAASSVVDERAMTLHATCIAAVAVLVAACAHPSPASPPATSSVAAPNPATEHVSFVDGTAGRLRVSDGGVGEPAVVLLHGLAADLGVWRGQLDHLRASRRVVAYDQRGHGGSERARDGVYTVDALVADLEAVRRAMGLGRVILVGHSMSGAVLTRYAAAHPDAVAGLVYVDGIGDFGAVPPEALEGVVARESSPAFGAAERRTELEGMLGPNARPETRRAILACLDRMDPPAFAALRRSVFALRDARALFTAYQGPSVAIEAAENPYAASMAGQVLGIPVDRIGGVSHWLQLDDPQGVNRALDAFFARVPAAR